MQITRLGWGLVWTACVFGQSKFSWQDACFKNPGAPYCQGHDFAIPKQPPAKDPASKSVVTNAISPNGRPSSTTRTGAPALMVVGGIDWRFADPFPDALIGFNFSSLSASPLARNLLTQLGTRQGLSGAEMEKIFDGLSDVDQVAVSVRGNRMIAIITGRVTEAALPAPEAGLKVLPLSGDAMLIGPPDLVDQAMQRINMKVMPTEWTHMAEERQASSEFWAIGSPMLAGPQAISAGLKRFYLTVSIRDRFISDVAFEFNGVPNPATIKSWHTSIGALTLEGNVAHVRMAMEANEVQQKFAQIVDGPVGEKLGALVAAGRYIPARDTSVPKQTHPVIYGLDDGPKVVNQ
jgi:hypothetical protein